MHDYDSRTLEAIVLVKAAPQESEQQDAGVQETGPQASVCAIALDLYGNWLRLSPVSFREAEAAQRLARWDRIRFRGWRPSHARDVRPEARQVGQKTADIIGQLPRTEQSAFLARAAVHSLPPEAQAGRTLALLKAEVLGFDCEKLGSAEFVERCAAFNHRLKQLELLGQEHLLPAEPVPYAFRYRLRDADGERVHTCADWEMDAVFLAARKRHGEKQALEEMERLHGVSDGVAFIMGGPASAPESWAIHGLVPLEETSQPTLF